MKQMLVVAALAMAVTAVAGAAAAWTPKQVSSLLSSRRVHLYGVRAAAGGTTSSPDTTSVSTARCIGAGSPNGGVYAAFSCALTWPNPNGIGQVHVSEFTRVWSPTAVCISSVSLGSCPPAPPTKTLPKDPRLCGGPDFGKCILAAANSAAAAAEKTAARPTAANTCKATSSWTSYICTGATVHFVSSPSGWITNAVVSP